MFLFHRKNRVNPDAAEFQPDAIMLESQEPGTPFHIIWFLIIALLGIVIVGACVAKVDKIVGADGKIVNVRPTITMKPFERTIIKQVHVRTGQHLKKGDAIFTFDQTTNQAELMRLREQLRSYTANSRRLHAELAGYKEGAFTLPENANEDEKLQFDIYSSRRNYYLSKVKSYDEQIIRYQKSLENLEMTMDKYKDRKAALDRIEKMMADLNEKKAASLKDLLTTQVEVIGMAIQIDQLLLSIVENRQQILTYQADRDAFIRDWQRQMVEELVDVDRNRISYEKEIPKVEVLVRNTELIAPCDCVVHELAPFQEGSAVQEAEALVTLIPVGVGLEAEIDIPAKDISWVKLGDTCRLKFDAYPFQQCGTLDGVITYISQDAFTQNAQAAAAARGELGDDGGRISANSAGVTYQARVKISGRFKGAAKDAVIQPGLRLRAEIKVGRRTVINYILNPLVKALDESGREP